MSNPAIKHSIFQLCERLFPICRSITGSGVRKTFEVLSEFIDIDVVEVPSGTPVFDWTVPLEWNISDAYVANESGERVIDFKENSLHVVSYSRPIRARMDLAQLQQNLHSLPDYPDWIPYRTSYYDESWGFCLEDRRRQALEPGQFEVVIDSSLEQGSLTYAECFIPGESEEEVLISTHICHPSLANDNLSGISVATHLAQQFARKPGSLHYSLRFIFIPGTIGSITWLSKNQHKLDKIVGGFVLTGVGDPGPVTYKKSRRGVAVIDRLFTAILTKCDEGHTLIPFEPYGYDERQFCSPGINLAMGCLSRTPFGKYPQYHTSGDNLDFIRRESLHAVLDLCHEVIKEFQHVRKFANLSPNCEPQLGRRGLYQAIGGDNEKAVSQLALLWVLNYSDGAHSTLDISEASGLSLEELDVAAQLLMGADLLERLPLGCDRTGQLVTGV